MQIGPAEISLIILAVAMVLYITELVPLVVTAIGSCAALVVFNVVPASVVWSGLSSNVNLLIAGMVVVGAAMFETGLAKWIGTKIVSLAGDSPVRVTVSIFLVVMVLSGFLNNTSTTAMMVPVVLGIVASSGGRLSDKHLLMPLGVAAVSGGMLTLAGSTPQVIVAGVLTEAGYRQLTFFEFAKMGSIICLSFMAYYFTIGKILNLKMYGPKPEPGPQLQEMLEEGVLQTAATEEEKDPRKIWTAGFILIGCIVAFIWSGLPLGTVAMMGALACVLTGCITEKRTYRLMDWRTVLLLGGSIGFAKGLDQSGGGKLLADFTLGLFGDHVTAFAIFAVITFLGMFLTQFMSNTATTAMLAPIALAMAKAIGADPIPMLMGLCMTTNASFSTPVATPPMTIVLAGGYRFVDYIKWCAPFNLVCWLLVLAFVPLLWGGLY